MFTAQSFLHSKRKVEKSMQKERLTRSIIEKDLIRISGGDTKISVLTSIAAWVISLIICVPFILLGIFEPSVFMLFIVASLLFMAATICILIYTINDILRVKRIKSGKYFIQIEKLIQSVEGRPGGHTKLSFSIPHTLYFKSGQYHITATKNYNTWSPLYCMTGTGIFNTATIGDSFILTGLPKEGILMVYNEKFFELHQEGS